MDPVATNPLARAHQSLGLTAGQNRDFEAAAGHFATAIALEPDRSGLHRLLGCALQDLGKLPEAERSFRRAMALDPQDVVPLSDLANLFWRQGRLEEAARAFERVLGLGLNLDPGNQSALLNDARLLCAM